MTGLIATAITTPTTRDGYDKGIDFLPEICQGRNRDPFHQLRRSYDPSGVALLGVIAASQTAAVIAIVAISDLTLSIAGSTILT